MQHEVFAQVRAFSRYEEAEMLRDELAAKLDRASRSYDELARSTTNETIWLAARDAVSSIELTVSRVLNPQTPEQQRRSADYVSKRLCDIAIRFNQKIAALENSDERKRLHAQVKRSVAQSELAEIDAQMAGL